MWCSTSLIGILKFLLKQTYSSQGLWNGFINFFKNHLIFQNQTNQTYSVRGYNKSKFDQPSSCCFKFKTGVSVSSGEDVKIREFVDVFVNVAIITLWKRAWPFISTNLNSPYTKLCVLSLAEIHPVALKKNTFKIRQSFNYVVISLCHN